MLHLTGDPIWSKRPHTWQFYTSAPLPFKPSREMLFPACCVLILQRSVNLKCTCLQIDGMVWKCLGWQSFDFMHFVGSAMRPDSTGSTPFDFILLCCYFCRQGVVSHLNPEPRCPFGILSNGSRGMMLSSAVYSHLLKLSNPTSTGWTLSFPATLFRIGCSSAHLSLMHLWALSRASSQGTVSSMM